MIKAVFFDVDGTLLSHKQKDVPQSARCALDRLAQLHVDRVVATGRHETELKILPVKDIDFDAYITLNGQLCFDAAGNIFYDNPLPEVDEILRLFYEKQIPVMLVEKEGMYINFINEDVRLSHEAISTPLPAVRDYTGNTLYQAIFYVDREKQAQITRNLKNVEITRWHECAVDVVAQGGSKVTGIERYIALKGYDREEIAAFGDGENDMEMLRYAGHGIAMGNADDAVKSVADHVTAHIDEDGIANGLRGLGLV